MRRPCNTAASGKPMRNAEAINACSTINCSVSPPSTRLTGPNPFQVKMVAMTATLIVETAVPRLPNLKA